MNRIGRVAVVATLALALATVSAYAVPIAGTSFEVSSIGTKYFDTGSAGLDHDLINNAGESDVDFTAAGGEIGFDAWYYNTRASVGLTDGDFVGTTNYAGGGSPGSYTDGTQGYQLSDTDGTMTTTFDTVALSGSSPTVFVDFWLAATTWETAPLDIARIWVVTNDLTEIDLLNTTGSDIDILMWGPDPLEGGAWKTASADLTGYTSATLSIELESNAGAEAMYIDNVRFDTVPEPATLSLLLIGGVFAARRRR